MKYLPLYLSILVTAWRLQAKAQQSTASIKTIEKIITKTNSATLIVSQLDSLKFRSKSTNNSVYKYFDRVIDFDFMHQRIALTLKSKGVQIDLLKKNDTIYAATIKSFHYYPSDNPENPTIYSWLDTANVLKFLSLHNTFYNSNKNIEDLLSEISQFKTFAFRCGDIGAKTEDGKLIEKLVEKNNIDTLQSMLQSICLETQVYGAIGFKMLETRGTPIPENTQKVVDHIKTKDAVVISCLGCELDIVLPIFFVWDITLARRIDN